MMIDFTQRDKQSNLLYNSLSAIKSSSNITSNSSSINNGSTITTGSSIASGASSIISREEESLIPADPYNLSFLTENQKYYQKLLDDLSIIDNIYDMINDYDQASVSDSSSSLYGKKKMRILPAGVHGLS